MTVKISGGSLGSATKQGATTVVSTKEPDSNSLEGNLNDRRRAARDSYNKWLLGTAKREDLGHELTEQYSTPPSWVQSHAGVNNSFSIDTYQSAEHEVTSLNAWVSGSARRESGLNAAFTSEYYSKEEKFITQTWKMSASVDLSGSSNGVVGEFVTGMGNMFSSNFDTPAIFKLNIPEYGRIKDIKVWVEVVASNEVPEENNLGSLFIALRSPNVTGFASMPRFNYLGSGPRSKESLIIPNAPRLSQGFFDSFILLGLNNTDSAHVWRYDKSVRTVFSDGSSNRNPYHHDPLYVSGSTDHNDYLLREGSPNYFFSASILAVDVPTGHALGNVKYGNGIHWISDSRIEPPLSNVNSLTDAASGSDPPAGWLSAAGPSAAHGEFQTEGFNLGPETIRPIYPLLDEVYEEWNSSISPFEENEASTRGTRPGLRDTEINGDWELLIQTRRDDSDPITNYHFFRQFRLEIVYEKNRHYNITCLKDNQPKTQWKTYLSSSAMILHTFVNDGGIDFPGVNEFPLPQGYSIGSFSIGDVVTESITSNTGSAPDFAVLTFITGSLAEKYNGANAGGWRHEFLNNEFGTPYIPLSSGSSEDPTFEVTNDLADNYKLINDTLSPKPLVGKATTLRSVLANKGVTTTTRDLALIIASDDDDA